MKQDSGYKISETLYLFFKLKYLESGIWNLESPKNYCVKLNRKLNPNCVSDRGNWLDTYGLLTVLS